MLIASLKATSLALFPSPSSFIAANFVSMETLLRFNFISDMLLTTVSSIPNGDDVWILEIEMNERMEAKGQEKIAVPFSKV